MVFYMVLNITQLAGARYVVSECEALNQDIYLNMIIAEECVHGTDGQNNSGSFRIERLCPFFI